mgnify:CR=1 FL=1
MATKPTLALIPSGYGTNKVYSVLPSDGSGDFTFGRTGTATRINKDKLIESVGSNIPRIDYLDSTCPSLLLEPQSTNFVTHSNDFSQSIYGKINLTITQNQSISPDGTQNANLLVPNATLGNRYLTNSTGSNLKINTVFLKKKELRYVNVGNAQSTVLVDLENGTISSSSVLTNNFTIENYGNGWYRISCYNTSDVNLQIQIFFGVDGSGSNIATNGTDGVYIYGFEIQNSSFPTSHIPTTGTSVTRIGETANKTGLTPYINDSEGVFYLEISRLNQGQTGSSIWSLSNGSNSNAVSMYYANSGIVVDIFSSSGVKILNYGMSFLEQANFNKLIIKYKSNDIALWVNGLKVAVNTNAISLSGLNQINASYGGGGFPFFGKTKDLRVYNTALTDLEIETLTSFTSFNAMALALNYTIY